MSRLNGFKKTRGITSIMKLMETGSFFSRAVIEGFSPVGEEVSCTGITASEFLERGGGGFKLKTAQGDVPPASRMGLIQLSNQELLQSTDSLVKEDRRISLAILYHLQEIERRKAYGEAFGCRSLFEYATQILHYSEGAAHRRISAMHALRKNPELAPKMSSGELNVSNVARVETFIRREEKLTGTKMPETKKLELYQSAENASHNQLEATLATMSPRAALKETVIRPVLPELHEMKVYLSSEDLAKWEELRGFLSHSLKEPGSNSELLKKIIAVAYPEVRRQKTRELKRPKKTTVSEQKTPPAGESLAEATSVMKPEPLEEISSQAGAQAHAGTQTQNQAPVKAKTLPQRKEKGLFAETHAVEKTPSPARAVSQPSSSREQIKSQSRYIARPLQRFVRTRAENRCEHEHPHTKKRCNSTFRTDIHHVILYARGGSSTNPKNLKLYCAHHNRLQAYVDLGTEKMNLYANRE